MKLIIFIAAIILSLFFALQVESKKNSSCPKTPFSNSDYMILVLSNQVSFCRTKSDCNQDTLRNLFNQNIFFTIHGLWPQLVNKIGGQEYPQCCSTDAFDENGLGALKKTMQFIAWPQITSFTLWDHEWSKHGTCALHAVPPTKYVSTQYQYFKSAVDLYFLANVNQRLSDAGVRPNDNQAVSVDRLNQIFSSALNVQPKYTYSSASGGRKLISEIWFCVSKDSPAFIPCPGTLKPGNEARSEIPLSFQPLILEIIDFN